MKKFLTDNMHILVLIALVLAGFAVYKICKKNKEDGKSSSDNSTTKSEE